MNNNNRGKDADWIIYLGKTARGDSIYAHISAFGVTNEPNDARGFHYKKEAISSAEEYKKLGDIDASTVSVGRRSSFR